MLKKDYYMEIVVNKIIKKYLSWIKYLKIKISEVFMKIFFISFQ